MATNAQLHVTKPKPITYGGARAVTFTVARTRSAAEGIGERVHVLEWLDPRETEVESHPAGSIVAKHIRGDGRTDRFECYDERVLASVEEAHAYAAERLA